MEKTKQTTFPYWQQIFEYSTSNLQYTSSVVFDHSVWSKQNLFLSVFLTWLHLLMSLPSSSQHDFCRQCDFTTHLFQLLAFFFSFLPWRWAISQGTMCYLKHFSETREQFVFKEEKKRGKKKEKRQLWENVLRQADYKSVQMGPYGWTNKQASLLAGKREWVRSASHIVFIKYVYKYGGLSFVLGRGSDVCCVHIRVLTFHYAV